MKITIDIDALREKGEISQHEYDRLATLGSQDNSTLAFNLLVGFGVMAVAAGIAALTRSASTTGIIGLLLLLAGVFIKQKNGTEWRVLANMLLITGALLFGGAVFATGMGGKPKPF